MTDDGAICVYRQPHARLVLAFRARGRLSASLRTACQDLARHLEVVA